MFGKTLLGFLGTTLIGIYIFLVPRPGELPLKTSEPKEPTQLPPTTKTAPRESIQSPPLIETTYSTLSTEQTHSSPAEESTHVLSSTEQTQSSPVKESTHVLSSTEQTRSPLGVESTQSPTVESTKPSNTAPLSLPSAANSLSEVKNTSTENVISDRKKFEEFHTREQTLIEKENQLKMIEKSQIERQHLLAEKDKELNEKEQLLTEKEKFLTKRENELQIREKFLKQEEAKLKNVTSTSVNTHHKDQRTLLIEFFVNNFGMLIASFIFEGLLLVGVNLCWRRQRSKTTTDFQHQHKMIEHLENGLRTSIKVFDTIVNLLIECREALSNFVQYKDFVDEIDVTLDELKRLTEEAEIRLNVKNRKMNAKEAKNKRDKSMVFLPATIESFQKTTDNASENSEVNINTTRAQDGAVSNEDRSSQ